MKARKSTKGTKRGPLKQDKASRGRRNRNKGHDYEREIAQFYRDLGFKNVRRTLQSRSGYEGSDVLGTPFHVECKHYKKIKVMRWWEQAIRDSHALVDVKKLLTKPVVLHIKETYGPELVMISKELWAKAVQVLREAEGKVLENYQ